MPLIRRLRTVNRDARLDGDGIDESREVSLSMLVHKLAVGAIIGQQGSLIKETQALTKAHIHVSAEPLGFSTDKNVTLSGALRDVHAAAIRIIDQLHNSPLKPGTKSLHYQPSTAPAAAVAAEAAPVTSPQQQQQPQQQQRQQGVLPMPVGMAIRIPMPTQDPYAQQAQQQAAAGPSSYAPRPPRDHLADPNCSTQRIAIQFVCCGVVIVHGGSILRRLSFSTLVPLANSPCGLQLV
jgi:hypothetical protein